VPELQGILPWERHLLLPIVGELLDDLLRPEQPRVEGEHEGTASEED
jgi:hypothetical protein